VKAFGAAGDGVTDDTAAIQAALDSGKRIYFPAGTYKVTASLTVPSGATLVGESKLRSTIKRATAATLISAFGAGAAMYDLSLDGNSSEFPSGKGILVGALSGRQTLVNVEVRNFPGPCLEFAADGGSGFSSFGSTYRTTGQPGRVASVRVAGIDTQAIPRKFYATESDGSTLFDFGGANNFYASGFYTNGLIFSPSSTKVELDNLRIGAAGGVVTIQGADHVISGVSAAPVILDCTGSSVSLQAPGWDITDRGSGNSVTILNRSHTPTWTAAGAKTQLGNGALHSRWSRAGNRVAVQLDLTIGQTTSVGSGTWEFSLPAPDNPHAPVQVCGVALAVNAAGTSVEVGAVRVQPGEQKVRIFSRAGPFGTRSPFAWAAGDTLRFGCEYATP
jgi:hypothetical protein